MVAHETATSPEPWETDCGAEKLIGPGAGEGGGADVEGEPGPAGAAELVVEVVGELLAGLPQPAATEARAPATASLTPRRAREHPCQCGSIVLSIPREVSHEAAHRAGTHQHIGGCT